MLPKVLSIIRSKSSSIRRISLEEFNSPAISSELEGEIYFTNLDYLSNKECSPLVSRFFKRCQHPSLSKKQLLRQRRYQTSYPDLEFKDLEDALETCHTEDLEEIERSERFHIEHFGAFNQVEEVQTEEDGAEDPGTEGD